jgi:hypothetical protein
MMQKEFIEGDIPDVDSFKLPFTVTRIEAVLNPSAGVAKRS